MKRHLFAIAPGLRSAIGKDEIESTLAALRELDLYRLPFDDAGIWLQFLADDICSFGGHPASEYSLGPSCTLEIGPLSTDPKQYFMCRMILRDSKCGFVEDVTLMDREWPPEFACSRGTDFLITLLATRNAVKITKEHKLAKLGIGKKSRFDYTTTISLPKPEEMDDDTEHAPTGVARCPHLRRGHIRNQHYGPAKAFVRRIWIAPIFVNADPSFVSTRKAYNLSPGRQSVPA